MDTVGAPDEDALELDAHRLRDTFDALREGVQILSPAWRYLYVNEAVAGHGRKRRDELLGRTMMECYPGIEHTEVFATLDRCMRERVAATIENEFEYGDGTNAFFELRIQPSREGLIVLSLDITERKQLEATVRQDQKLRALGQMAASVAHDLKNVLNAITLQATLLHRPLSHEQADEVLVQIETAIRTGADTVERLRRFSRQEPEPIAEATDLDRVTDTAIEICRPRTREHPGVELRRERAETPPALVRASELATAVVNLVVNALDAVGAQGTITVRTGTSAGGGFIEIADDGAGMPAEVERRAFEPFFTTKAQGTGLGLSMAYAFVHRHGGRIAVETSPGQGTTIRMWFPAAPARPAETAPAPEPGRRVLIVEDDAGARTALGALLADEGFAVEVAPDGEQALARFERFDPDVLLIDYQMPGMDGATVTRHARARKARLPVVVMSGVEASHAAVAPLLREPGTEHVRKPIDLDQLVAALGRVLAPGPVTTD